MSDAQKDVLASWARTLALTLVITLLLLPVADHPPGWLPKLDPDTLKTLSSLTARLPASILKPAFMLVASFAFSLGVEQNGWLKVAQDFVFPPKPFFLEWSRFNDPKLPWSKRLPFTGRGRELAQLMEFARARTTGNRSHTLIHGIYGPLGVGKTRIASEWMRTLHKRGWHVGQLKAPIPDTWRFVRPTAILVPYGNAQAFFWDSLDVLSLPDNRFQVRILFESPMDFELLASSAPARRVAQARSLLWKLPSRAAQDREHEAPRAQTWETREREKQSVPIPAQAPAGADTPVFTPVRKLADRDVQTLARALLTAYKAGHLATPEILATIGAQSRGRPQYVVSMCIKLSRNEKFNDPYAVSRDEARNLIEEAERAFPENFLFVLILAALGVDFDIPITTGVGVVNGALDRQRLQVLFRSFAQDGGRAWARQLGHFFPSISDVEIARLVSLMAVSRLPPAALARLTTQTLSEVTNDELWTSFYEAVVTILDRPEGQAALIMLFLSPVLNGSRATFERQLITHLRTNDIGTELSDHELLYAVEGLQEFIKAVLLSPRAYAYSYNNAQGIPNRATQTMVAIFRTTTDPKRRRAIIEQYAAVAGEGTFADDLKTIVAGSEQWLASDRLADLVAEFFRGSPVTLDWLDMDALFEKQTPPAAGQAPQAIIDDAHIADTFKATEMLFRMFDTAEEYRDPGDTSRNFSDEDVGVLEALFLRPDDPVGVLTAIWAIYWQAAPTMMETAAHLPLSLRQHLISIVNTTHAPATLRKRALAVLGKINAGSDYDDVIYEWAVWTDTLSPKMRPKPYLFPEPEVSRLQIGPALGAALVMAGDRREHRTVRRSAAYFAVHYEPSNEIVLRALADAVRDRSLIDQERRTFILRLYQAASTTRRKTGQVQPALDIFVELMRSQSEDVGSDAFLALCALDWLHLVNPNDFRDLPYASRYWYDTDYTNDVERFAARTFQAETRIKGSIVPKKISPPHTTGDRPIWEIQATDINGQLARYFLLVDADKSVRLLDLTIATADINLEDFGEVIASCYGSTVNDAIRSKLKTDYNFDVSDH